MASWNKKWLDLVDHISAWSRDPSTKVAAVIVDSRNNIRSLGYNGLPRDVVDDMEERWERPIKYKWVEHAERNAIYAAATHGTPIGGCTIYLGWYPCADCARAIIQSGIVNVIIDGRKYDPVIATARDSRWAEDFAVAEIMFGEAGVEVYIVSKEDME